MSRFISQHTLLDVLCLAANLAGRAAISVTCLVRTSPHIVLLIVFSSQLAMPAISAQDSETNVPIPEMVLIPGSSYEVGSLLDYRAQPIHQVELKPFYIGKYEITFEQFDAFTQATGKLKRNDLGWGRGNNPIVDITWEDANEYAEWLSSVTGETYRLPTEVEWEYAARAGNYLAQYSWGDEIGKNSANCRGCGSQWDGKSTAPAGSFEANQYGLYDMHGNVWELTSNCYSLTYRDAVSFNPEADSDDCKSIVVRGGSWDTDSSKLKIWSREPNRKVETYNDVGFRLIKEVD